MLVEWPRSKIEKEFKKHFFDICNAHIKRIMEPLKMKQWMRTIWVHNWFFYFFNEFKLKNIHCTIGDNTLIDHIKYFFVFLLQIDWFTLIFRDSILTWFGKGRKTIYVFDFRPLHVRSTRDECTSHVCKEFKRGTISVSLFKCVCVFVRVEVGVWTCTHIYERPYMESECVSV